MPPGKPFQEKNGRSLSRTAKHAGKKHRRVSRRTEEKERTWCLSMLHKKLKKHQIQERFDELESFARGSFPETGCFNMNWLRQVIEKIDELWYEGKMLPDLYRVYGGLHLYVDSPEERVAGYVMETADGKSISLHMNRDLFASLFKKQERGYHSGGLLCEDRLVCLLHVILHESVHLILTACDRQGFRPDIRDHGKEFNKIVKNLFGQTDPQHGLIPGYEQFHDLNTIRNSLKPGTKVEVFLDGGWYPCMVRKKGYKWVEVETRPEVSYTVHAGLLRLPGRLHEK